MLVIIPMIGKIIKGKNFKACLSYVMRKKDAVIIDTNIMGNSVDEYADEFDYYARQRPNLEKKVCHMMLSLPVYEKVEDGTWGEILNQYLNKMGFGKSHYVAVKHSDRSHEHIHIVANRVTLDGNVVSDSWDRMQSQEAIREIEKDYGLTQVKSSWECDRQSASQTTGQLKYENKIGMPLIKSQIADRVDAALGKSTNIDELTAELNANQVGVKVSKNRKGEPMGISYSLDNVSVAGSRIGRIYSYSQVLKRLENNVRAIAQGQDSNVVPLEHKVNVAIASENISPLEQNAIGERITKAIAIAEIPVIIRANVKPNMTMPELVDRLRELGVDAYVKYTRTKKVKGISFSVGNESIAGNELGKEYSFNGLQKHLGVSFDPERDNPKLDIRLIDSLKVDGRSPVEIKPSEEKLSEVATVEIKAEELRPPVVTILESSTVKPILKTQQLVESELITKEQALMARDICKEAIKVTGENEYRSNFYSMKLEENTLILTRLETGEVVLKVKDPEEIQINKLTFLDIERFNIAMEERDKEKQIERGKTPNMER